MALTDTAVRKVAKLSRIHIPDADLPRMTQRVSGILGWIEQLSEVNTDDVEPVFSVVPAVLPWREDAVTDGHQRDAVLQNAPKQDYGCFVVPKVIE